MTERKSSAAFSGGLAQPHGGVLNRSRVSNRRRAFLRDRAPGWPQWQLDGRQLCEAELILNGAYSPLMGFMTRLQVDSVCQSLRLPEGLLWPLPITLEIDPDVARRAAEVGHLALYDTDGALFAVLEVEDTWHPDRYGEAAATYGTLDPQHPGVAEHLLVTDRLAIGGPLERVGELQHLEFRDLRLTPRQLRQRLAENTGPLIAYGVSQPLHRLQAAQLGQVAKQLGGRLLLQASPLGEPILADPTLVPCLRVFLRHIDPTSLLVLTPLVLRPAGPRQALLEAIVRQNFGCTHVLIEDFHADPGPRLGESPFYAAEAGRGLIASFADELQIRALEPPALAYFQSAGKLLPPSAAPVGESPLEYTDTELRHCLAAGRRPPEWFTFDGVARELAFHHPPRHRQGFTIFFTGLSAAGKSTIANALRPMLIEQDRRRVSLLDGRSVRDLLAAGLGFSRADHERNLRRLAFIAAEITRHAGIAICAPVAPWDSLRKEVRARIEDCGGFVLVFVDTHAGLCEERDPKGLWAAARRGLLQPFPGVTEPYEVPDDAEIRLDTVHLSPTQAAEKIIDHLRSEGYLEDRS